MLAAIYIYIYQSYFSDSRHICLVWFDLISLFYIYTLTENKIILLYSLFSLFNGISTFVVYLMPRYPCKRTLALRQDFLEPQEAVSLGSNPPWKGKVYRLEPEAPLLREYRRDQKHFGAIERIWATALHPDPP